MKLWVSVSSWRKEKNGITFQYNQNDHHTTIINRCVRALGRAGMKEEGHS